MGSMLSFLIVIFVVGFVTGGLKIRFDRFFAIIMLMTVAGKGIRSAIDLFLWVIMLGSLYIILENQEKIKKMPKAALIKFFTFIPLMTFFSSLLGTYLNSLSSDKFLTITLGILALLYGLRMIFIHFKEHEMNHSDPNPKFVKFCGVFGPIISGFSIGFIGTSLKSLKLPLAIKGGKMNAKQVYLGNTMTAFFSSLFAIIWHYVFTPSMTAFDSYIYAISLWASIHFIYDLTNVFFKDTWRKNFQILVGIALVLVSFKFFFI